MFAIIFKGCKIEAVSRRDVVDTFNDVLKQGCSYTMHRVVFRKVSGVGFSKLAGTYEWSLLEDTIVVPFSLPMQFPPLPKHLMPLPQVYIHPNKSFTGNAIIHSNMFIFRFSYGKKWHVTNHISYRYSGNCCALESTWAHWDK